MFKKKLPLRKKLLLLSIIVGLGSIALTGRIAIQHSSDAILAQRGDALQTLCAARRNQTEEQFHMLRAQARELARSTMTVEATEAFSTSFERLPTEACFQGQLDRAVAQLDAYYGEIFGPTVGKRLLPQNAASIFAQLSFLVSNQHPQHEKEQLVASNYSTEYNQVHARFHPIVRSFLNSFSYDDVFLIDHAGRIVYSVKKEVDFGTNLVDGRYALSGLARAYRYARFNAAPGEVHIEDYSSYAPSQGKLASFASTPIMDNGKCSGVLAVKLPTGKINAILGQSLGLGKTGNIYLVGPDGRMRSEGRFSPDQQALGDTIVNSPAITNALLGETGTLLQNGPQGERVLAAYSPLDIPGLQWCIVAELAEEELLDPAMRLRTSLAWTALGIAMLVTIFAFIMTSLMVHKQYESELLISARLDKLTQLPNRELFTHRLDHAFAKFEADARNTFAVLFLDFDRFKMVNDSFGHDVGDLLLKEIALRLRLGVDPVASIDKQAVGNTIARLGGDEFVVLADTGNGKPSGEEVAEKLLEVLNRPYKLGIHEVHSTASIGLVKSSAHYADAKDMLRDADTAMYEAKLRGKARYVTFDVSMQETIQERIQFENDIAEALENKHFELAFQPIFSMSDGTMVSAEALLRWNHPVRGPISPDEFIPICEDLGLVIPISEWVFREACHQKAKWNLDFPGHGPETISVNLSHKHFTSGDLPATVCQILAETGLQASELQMEITETAVMHDAVASRNILKDLKEVGVKLALDDFGAGHSTLAMLRDFPIDLVKIDRAFTFEANNSKQMAALVHAVAVLAHNLGLKTVAEGIESADDFVMLQTVGCDYGQGYYLGSPMSTNDFIKLLEERTCGELEVTGAMVFANNRQNDLTLIELD